MLTHGSMGAKLTKYRFTNAHLFLLHEEFGERGAARRDNVVKLTQVGFTSDVHQKINYNSIKKIYKSAGIA